MLGSPTTELLQDAVDPLLWHRNFQSEAHRVDEQLPMTEMADLQILYKEKHTN